MNAAAAIEAHSILTIARSGDTATARKALGSAKLPVLRFIAKKLGLRVSGGADAFRAAITAAL